MDDLVERLLNARDDVCDDRRKGYNEFLGIADKLLEAPELAFVKGSSISTALSAYPSDLVDYFDPIKAPEWVIGEKLDRASKLWERDKLGMIGALYCASLPSCYLLKNGIPALYESAKLKDRQYIYQRIYETGVFLEAVMSSGGIYLINDLPEDLDGFIAEALNRSDPDANWTWDGRTLRRLNQTGQKHDPQEILKQANSIRPAPQRYLWGKGLVSAKKVRFLHASMRSMLSGANPAGRSTEVQVSPTVTESLGQQSLVWNEAELGKPINQEDLAYTMLSFGYMIPLALRHWGCRWTAEEEDAFLHLWVTVGHIMGIKDELLPNDWTEAEQLFERIQCKEAAASEQGEELTDALMEVLGDYLPSVFGLEQSMPPILIEKQLGSNLTDLIFNSERKKLSQRFSTRALLKVGLRGLQFYYLARRLVFRTSPTIAKLVGGLFSQSGTQLIGSWQGGYDRRPFYVPAGVDTWHRRPGTDENFRKRIRLWRRSVFYTIVLGVSCIFGFTILIPAFLVLFFLGQFLISMVCGALGGAGLLAGIITLRYLLPRLGDNRPVLSQT